MVIRIYYVLSELLEHSYNFEFHFDTKVILCVTVETQ